MTSTDSPGRAHSANEMPAVHRVVRRGRPRLDQAARTTGRGGNGARAVGAAQGSGPRPSATLLVDALEWATAEDFAAAFPTLGDEQIETFRRFGAERTAGAGEALYRQQDPHLACT